MRLGHLIPSSILDRETYKRLGEILSNQRLMIEGLNRIEGRIMGLKEDFSAFVAAVNQRTNEIAASLTDINADIDALMATASVPPEVLEGMKAVTDNLSALADTAKAIADRNTAVVPPPVEPL